jgi:hypothetical protein
MRHGMRRQDPQGISQQLKTERASEGLETLPENAAYEATRAQLAATRKQRQARAADKRKRDADLRRRGIDPERHVDAVMLDLDEAASTELGVPSLREQLRRQ